MNFIENFDLNIDKSIIDTIQLGNKEFRNIIRTNSKSTLKNLKSTNKDIQSSLKSSEIQIKKNIRAAELEINTVLSQIRDPSTLIDTSIRTGQRGFRANVMTPMNNYKNKFINTLKSGYREKIIKPLAIIDRGARRGVVNSDVAARKLLKQIKPINVDSKIRKYVLKPLNKADIKAKKMIKKGFIEGVIKPANYVDKNIKKTLSETNKSIKKELQKIKGTDINTVDIYVRSQLKPINKTINDTQSSVIKSTYSGLREYSKTYDQAYVYLFNILIKSYLPKSNYKGEGFLYMLVWSFFLLLALISQTIYDATVGNIIDGIRIITGFDLSGKGIKKDSTGREVPNTVIGVITDSSKDIWTKNSLVKKIKNIFYKFFLIIASIFDLITLAFINNATFFSDLVTNLFGAAPAKP